ncbi:MAG: BMP family protein [Anaerolineae bacterium]|nr:BMP family protein [Anaerolineae bacterium]
MKNTLRILYLIVILALALAACAPQAAPTEAPAAQQKIKVALVLPGTINDNGWSQVAYDGVMAGAKETGAEVAYTESSQLPDFEAIYRDYANKGYTLVIGHGSEYADVALKIGKEFPKTYFAVTNADVKAENVAGLDTKNEEAGYLAGFIAGTLTKTKKVGIIGAMEIVAMKRAGEGFDIGAKASCPDCQTMHAWVGSFDDAGKGKETAMAMIEQGVDVVYANADAAGIGIISGCKEKGVMVIGDTGDQSSLAPDLVITSMMQNLNPMFVEIMQEVANGKFIPNNVRMNGFDTGIYFIADLNKKLVSDEQAAKILAEVEKVKNNQVKLPHMSASAK